MTHKLRAYFSAALLVATLLVMVHPAPAFAYYYDNSNSGGSHSYAGAFGCISQFSDCSGTGRTSYYDPNPTMHNLPYVQNNSSYNNYYNNTYNYASSPYPSQNYPYQNYPTQNYYPQNQNSYYNQHPMTYQQQPIPQPTSYNCSWQGNYHVCQWTM